MKVRYIKDFTGHTAGNVIDTDVRTANFLIEKGVCEKYPLVVKAPVVETPVVETPVVEAPVVKAPVVKAPVVTVETSEIFSAAYLAAVETLKSSDVAELPYPEMRKLVDALGIKTNGATKPALIKGLNDFKNKL